MKRERERTFTMVAEHAKDCAKITVNGAPLFLCGGTYVCVRCECEFGWCLGCYDGTPALCDECANLVQEGWAECGS